MSSAVTEMPRCRIAIRNVPPPGVTARNVIGNAALTVRQRSVKIGCGGALGALQAWSMAASNAQAAHRGRGKHVVADAAILKLQPDLSRREPSLASTL